jgi:hypothetical protein
MNVLIISIDQVASSILYLPTLNTSKFMNHNIVSNMRNDSLLMTNYTNH